MANKYDPNEEEIKAMQEVIKSGDFSMGKKVLEFEREFASYVKSKYSIMINSGSSANLLMISALMSNLYSKRLKMPDQFF